MGAEYAMALPQDQLGSKPVFIGTANSKITIAMNDQGADMKYAMTTARRKIGLGSLA
jgi:hypothetical protein